MPAKHVKSRREDRDYEDLVRLYLEDVGRHDLLTKDDEIRLAQAIEAGRRSAQPSSRPPRSSRPRSAASSAATIRQGEEAHRQFVNSNLRLVVSIAKKYQSSGPPAPRHRAGGQPRPHPRRRQVRLAQGLQVLDVRDVVDPPGDPARHRQLGARDPAPRPRRRHAHRAAQAARRSSKARSAARRRWPSWRAEAELPLEKVVEVLRYAVDTVSLDEPVRDDGDAELGDFVEDRNAVAPFDHAATSLLPGEVAKVLSVLDERERTILHAALRPRRWRRAHARGSGRALRSHPGAHPPDRGPGDVEAAAPVGRRRRTRAARSRLTNRTGEICGRPSGRPFARALLSRRGDGGSRAVRHRATRRQRRT